MNTKVSTLGIALATALVATTAITPLASAQEWRRGAPARVEHSRVEHVDHGRGHDNGAAWLGLGIAAIAGAAIIANATAPQPVYAPQPAYVQPTYAAPAYVQAPYVQAPYVQQTPTCTTINGYAACLGPDGTWQYVR
jgi:hypothetical protein